MNAKNLPVSILILFAALIQGCTYKNGNINIINSVNFMVSPPVSGPGFAFYVGGVGKCALLKMDWGDGNVETVPNYDLTQQTPIFHNFAGWGGGKTITAIGDTGCLGTAQTKIDVAPTITRIGFNAGPTTCTPVPGHPSLAGRTLIHIDTILAAKDPHGIDFGCQLYGCIYDADGKPNSVAGTRFPFPGLREFSLVIRVGTEVFQGGMKAQFMSTQNAPLEICLNDDNLADNIGGYEIDITTDQLGPDLSTPTPSP